MKIVTTRNVDNQLGDLESHKVRIKASGKAFSTLVRGIYSDNIAAFVREIATNALDAHTQHGNPKRPFRVDLPDSIDPYYRVRDFGVSMDHDTVINVFGTLFESTKDDSNEVVGAFGLGSKAPLAYADSFEVTAFLDGERRSYLVSVDEEGTPVITLLSTTPSSEDQGIEVAIPIRESDFTLVHRAASNILPGFDVMPEILGASDIKPFDVYATVNDDEVRLVEPPVSSYGGSTTLKVRMGCVLYPVALHQIGFDYQNSPKFRGCEIIVNVPIGSVGITTSREALDLTTDTKDLLNGIVERATVALENKLEAEFASCTSRLEAVRKYVEEGVASYWGGEISYRGKPLSSWIFLDGDKPLKYGVARDYLPEVRKETKRGANPMSQIKVGSVAKTRFVYGDTKAVKRATVRYREYVSDNSDSLDVYWLTNPTKTVMERLTRLAGFTSANFVWVGNLTDPGPIQRGSQGPSRKGKPQGVKVAERGAASWGPLPDCDEYPSDYYWIEGSRMKGFGMSIHFRTIELIEQHGGDNLPLLVFTPSACKRYKPNPDRRLDEAIKLTIAPKKAAITKAYLTWCTLHSIHNESLGEILVGSYDKSFEELTPIALTEAEINALENEADEQVETYKKTYPLLFTPTSTQIKAYIKDRDNI